MKALRFSMRLFGTIMCLFFVTSSCKKENIPPRIIKEFDPFEESKGALDSLGYAKKVNYLKVGQGLKIRTDIEVSSFDDIDLTQTDTTVLRFEFYKKELIALPVGRGISKVTIEARGEKTTYKFIVESRLDDGVTKVLAIGNSFSEDASESYFWPLSHQGKKTVVVGNVYIGGGALSDHVQRYVNGTPYSFRYIGEDGVKTTHLMRLEEALQLENWDYVSVQQVSHQSGVYNSFFPNMPNLLNIIKPFVEFDCEILFHQIWAYDAPRVNSYLYFQGSQQVMYDSIQDVSHRIAEQYGLTLIPAGKAIQQAREAFPETVFTRDQYHLHVMDGRFIAAGVWYQYIFGDQDIRQNSLVPVGMSPERAQAYKELIYQQHEKDVQGKDGI